MSCRCVTATGSHPAFHWRARGLFGLSWSGPDGAPARRSSLPHRRDVYCMPRAVGGQGAGDSARRSLARNLQSLPRQRRPVPAAGQSCRSHGQVLHILPHRGSGRAGRPTHGRRQSVLHGMSFAARLGGTTYHAFQTHRRDVYDVPRSGTNASCPDSTRDGRARRLYDVPLSSRHKVMKRHAKQARF